MNKQQAINIFKESYSELLKNSDDYCERQLAWNCFIDGLCKYGEITQKQYDNWGNPACLNKRARK